MMQKEDLDKLGKVDRDRIIEVWSIIERIGMKHPNKVLSETFKKSSGEISTYLNAKKSMPDTFYRDFIKKYDTQIAESKPISLPEPKSDNISQEIIRDLARSGIVLAEANKIQAQANSILSEANKILAVNNKDTLSKFNSSSPSISLSVPSAFVQKLAEVLAKKYSLQESVLLGEIGNTLSAFRASMIS